MQTFLKASSTIVSAAFLTVMFFSATSSAETIEIWGSTTCQKRFLEPASQSLEKNTGIKITVKGVGTGKGLIALVDGETRVSAASEDLEGAINSAKKVAAGANRSLKIPPNLQYHEIISDLIIPIVHKDNPVSDLTWRQLRDINSGAIDNWREVGGPNLPVQVITSHAGSATRAVFQRLVMEGKEYAFDAIIVDSTRKEILAVTKNKAAIGAVSMGFLKLYAGDTRPIRTAKISRPLGLITVGAPESDVRRLIDFLKSDEAKKHFN